jgi:TPR repeat protein
LLKLAFGHSVAITLTPVMGSAQDFDAGVTAYEAGDYARALREWRPLAEQGDMKAQFNLGRMYHAGNGVPQDYITTVAWYLKAAEQGDAQAQLWVGVMYAFGMGVPQDYETAHMWYNLASRNGDADGSRYRDGLAAKMTPENISEAQRRARVCLASEYQDCD